MGDKIRINDVVGLGDLIAIRDMEGSKQIVYMVTKNVETETGLPVLILKSVAGEKPTNLELQHFTKATKD